MLTTTKGWASGSIGTVKLGIGTMAEGKESRSQHQFSSVQSFSHVRLFAIPWTAALQASLSITNSRSLLKLMSIESVMPSNCLILCHPLLLRPSIFPSIRVFSSESVHCIRWPKDWSFSISPSNEYSGLIYLGLTGCWLFRSVLFRLHIK